MTPAGRGHNGDRPWRDVTTGLRANGKATLETLVELFCSRRWIVNDRKASLARIWAATTGSRGANGHLGDGTVVAATPAPTLALEDGVTFNRHAAVAWATEHFNDPQAYPAACTWFVSLALWAGGLPQTPLWTSAGSHGHPWSKRPGSVAAWCLPEFLACILSGYPRSTLRQLPLSPTTQSVPDAQLGDVILFDWRGQSTALEWTYLRHAALIVDFAAGHGPLVAEWAIDGRKPNTCPSRFWTWSARSREWLAVKYPRAQAFLLHIEAGA
jgi:hypothetical protein